MRIDKTTTYKDVKRLYNLKKLEDFEIADNETDIIQWNVFSSDNVKIGKVEDLIVDKDNMKVEYADMIVDKHFVTGTAENHLLIPMEMIHLDKENKKVFVTKIVSKDLAFYPLYNGSNIPANYEQTLREKLIQAADSKATDTTNPNL
ncbi:MAG: PRC-barrel domain-containing protein [Bacteroidetes bacterium]|nr:PRC-barrel domain-containing protein [Bacteroidota bacterium]HET6245195.1 PRC-barrel domain-containing protein [Bacteroidia bacterium]